jgi:cytochrome c553
MLDMLKNKTRVILILFICMASVATYALQMDYNIGYAPEQPIAFSHKLHAGKLEMDCLYCHSNAEKGPHATVPPMSTCMGCHSVVATSSPEIKKLTEYYEQGKPAPWIRIHRVPDHVYFTHQIHLNAGIECQTCHGDIQEMKIVEQVNRLEMGDCVTCHRNEDYATQSYEKNPELSESRYHYLRYISDVTKSSKKSVNEDKTYEGDAFHHATGITKYQNAPTSCDVCHQ